MRWDEGIEQRPWRFPATRNWFWTSRLGDPDVPGRRERYRPPVRWRRFRAKTGLAAVSVAALVGQSFVGMPAARAYDYGLPLNGTYAATSNGDWAQSNDVYQNQVSVRQIWTITSSCDNPRSCTGRITSDEGWSADLKWLNMWTVRREVLDWQRCSDGSAYPGSQMFRFTPVGEDGRVSIGSGTLAGEDKTTGTSGACGVGEPLVVRQPLRLDKI